MGWCLRDTKNTRVKVYSSSGLGKSHISTIMLFRIRYGSFALVNRNQSMLDDSLSVRLAHINTRTIFSSMMRLVFRHRMQLERRKLIFMGRDGGV